MNGDLLHRDDAKVSVYDSGFMLGDGMWEGLRLYDGTWAFFDEHMDCFFDSCKAVSLNVGMDRSEILEALNKTVAANGMVTDVHCRLMLTRGVKVKPFQHPSLSRSGPTFVIIMEHSRLNCVIACLQAEQAGADEGLMLDPNGFVNTTNACNFFIVRKGEVWTSTSDYCMNGVTRQKVIDVCHANGIVMRERNYSLYEAYGADEVFLTGTFGAQTPSSAPGTVPSQHDFRPYTAN